MLRELRSIAVSVRFPFCFFCTTPPVDGFRKVSADPHNSKIGSPWRSPPIFRLHGALRFGSGDLLTRAIGGDGATDKPKENFMTTTEQKPAASKAPTHIAYTVRDLDNDRSFWTRIGSAWAHADGNGFNIQVDAVPLDGRITLRVATDAKA